MQEIIDLLTKSRTLLIRAFGLALITILIVLYIPSAWGNDVQTSVTPQPLGIALDEYEYPHPVTYRSLSIESQDVRMAYMDVPAVSERPNGETVLLMHGKNFFGAYWNDTIEALRSSGYRVVVPDQVGFGKSAKPNIAYSFELLAKNTKSLLDELEIENVHVVGHSMGGMLAVRFALMYPQSVTSLTLENPIGLEDYRQKVPFRDIETEYESILSWTEKSIRDYHRTYYVEWQDAYNEYVMVHYRWTLGGEWPRLAWATASTFEMVYTQPVVQDLPMISVPTLLVIGQADRTTLGRGRVSDEVLETLGQYPELGRAAAQAIPDATLVELKNVGHIPHFEAPRSFHKTLIKFLSERSMESD